MGEAIGISPSVIIYSERVSLAAKIMIGEYSVIGRKASYVEESSLVRINESCIIGAHVIVYEGVTISEQTQIEDFCRIGENTQIGKNCRLVYGTKIYGGVKIGDHCVIGGFICEDAEIGHNCRIFGELIHKHDLSNVMFEDMQKWDEGGEWAPIIHNNVFIGFGAKIIGDVTIGMGSFIYPNAIVTKNVPANTNVLNINEHRPRKGS